MCHSRDNLIYKSTFCSPLLVSGAFKVWDLDQLVDCLACWKAVGVSLKHLIKLDMMVHMCNPNILRGKRIRSSGSSLGT